MSITTPDPSCLLGDTAALITDEVKSAINRMIYLANGELLPAEPTLTSAAADGTGQPEPQPRIYTRAPHLPSIEYIINRALGVPGADIECYQTTPSCSERIQAAKDRETGTDYSALLTESEQMFVDALAMAIERLKEHAAGITVQRMRNGKPYTISRKPGARAIEYLADRVAGKTGSILGVLQDRIENPDTDRNYSDEEIDRMTEVEKLFLKEALERKHSESTEAISEEEDENTENPDALPLPDYVVTANQTLISFLPEAITHMKTLARGAQTIIETETERKVYNHEADARANTFLINRFMGAPTNLIQIERIISR